MRRNLILALAVFTSLVVSGRACSAPITIEPDAFADGTVLNNISPAVALFTSVNATDLTSNFGFNVTAATDGFGHTSTGTKVFAHAGGIPFFNSSRNLRMTFTDPIAQLALDFIPSAFSEVGTLSLYNASGLLLATLQTTNPQTDVPQTLSFLRPTADVKFVVASGTGPFVRIDAVRFDTAPGAGGSPIPEPLTVAVWTALGLTAVGVMGVPRVRRLRPAIASC